MDKENELKRENRIARFNKAHDYEYLYDIYEYVPKVKYGIVTCRIHGNFKINICDHMKGYSKCKQCHPVNDTKTKTLKKLYEVFGDKYKFEIDEKTFRGSRSKVTRICKHGKFDITSRCLLRGDECFRCKKGIEGYKERVQLIREKHSHIYIPDIMPHNGHINGTCEIHGDVEINVDNINRSGCIKCISDVNKIDYNILDKIKSKFPNYDYTNTEYKGTYNEIFFACEKHGIVSRRPSNLLKDKCKYACLKCSKENRLREHEDFIKSCIEKYPELDYSKTKYLGFDKKITIICSIHGELEYGAGTFINKSTKYGCERCTISIKDKVIEKVKLFENINHDNIIFDEDSKIVKLECNTHGTFERNASSVLTIHNICSKCSNVESRGEKQVRNYLESQNIVFVQECRIDRYYYDFYLPEYNVYIEYNGQQHYMPIEFFGGIETFEATKERDIIKIRIIEEMRAKLLIIPYWDFDKIEDIISNFIE